jgi:predicted DNA binding CopG/RHH family protein
MEKRKSLPKFENEDQERAFWAEQDSAEYVDWSKAKKAIFPNLKPTSKTISLRLPGFLLDELKLIAHKRDIPYQSLIKIFLKDKIDQELSRLP